MKTSEQINDIAKALSKFQGELESAAKSSVNPHFKSSYADLAECWATIREPLAKNGLCVVQTTEVDVPAQLVCVITRLIHESGQWFESTYPLWPSKQDPQGYGAALTYARRYCLTAIVGLTQDDDDGNAASGKPPAAQHRSTEEKTWDRTNTIVERFAKLGVTRENLEKVFGPLDAPNLNMAGLRKTYSEVESSRDQIAKIFGSK
jgi:hypothetical protein